jgi:hypothetical protein
MSAAAMHELRQLQRNLGGVNGYRWKDGATLVRCYQQTDDRTLLAVMGERALRASAPERFARHRLLITQSIIMKKCEVGPRMGEETDPGPQRRRDATEAKPRSRLQFAPPGLEPGLS